MNIERDESREDDPFSLPPVSPRMKAFSLAVFFLIGFALGGFVFWNPFGVSWLPRGPEKPVDKEASVHPGEVSQAELWTCPMHPEVIERESGDCPICHMKLVKLAPHEGSGQQTPGKEERKTLHWQAPMDPTYISDRPGKSPMGMDLVPVYADEGGVGAEGEVLKIDPAIVQQIGVRTEAVRVGELRHVIRTVGILDYNEKNISLVNTKFDGWIEKVHVNYLGEKVKKGQGLFEIYSPELVSTQEEYLTALSYLDKMKESGSQEAAERAQALWEATRKRLAYWDITEEQIERLEETGEVQKRLTVVSPASGVVVEKMAAALEGMYAKAGMNLYKIADLSTVWVHADIYESELPRVRPGLRAEVTLPYFPGEKFAGSVLFLQPFLTEKTRTVKACIEIENRDRRLEPGMYADVKIKPVASERAVQVPEDAVIRTGERNLVFVALGEGKFLPKEVELGVKGEGVYEVKRGLVGGENIVVSAQFLLDSESRLQEFIRKLTTDSKGGKP
jgi:Cu(I)/Ag(I) efflux system membrane fusion protein/cobalt-zinc-cadmium efflux system membrane fusion protein